MKTGGTRHPNVFDALFLIINGYENVRGAHENVPVLCPVHGHARGHGYKLDEHAHEHAFLHYACGDVYDGLPGEYACW